jgi:hypothetical protein
VRPVAVPALAQSHVWVECGARCLEQPIRRFALRCHIITLISRARGRVQDAHDAHDARGQRHACCARVPVAPMYSTADEDSHPPYMTPVMRLALQHSRSVPFGFAGLRPTISTASTSITVFLGRLVTSGEALFAARRTSAPSGATTAPPPEQNMGSSSA